LNSVAAQRPAAWFEYFNELGCPTRVLTSTYISFANEQKGVFRVRTDLYGKKSGLFLAFRKLRSFFEVWLPFIYPAASRYSGLISNAEKLIKSERPDVLIATGEPFVLFGITKHLSEKFQIPWVADYRDPWTNTLSSKIPLIFRKIQISAEKRWILQAKLLTTASPSYKDKIFEATKHPSIEVVYNGHNIKKLPPRRSVQKKFRIAYSGRLYDHQPIEKIVNAFCRFLEVHEPASSNIEFIFFGLADWPSQVKRIKQLAGKHKRFFKFLNQKPYDDYIGELSLCQLFILISKKDIGWLNAKVFDYLSLPGEILLYPPEDGVLNKILLKAKKGKIAKDLSDIQSIISNLYDEYINGKDQHYPLQINNFSRKNEAEKMISILKKALSSA